MIFLYIALALFVGFSIGYFAAVRRMPHHLAKFTTQELKALSDLVAKERKKT